jgi:2'-5' RNA ligase
MRLFVALPLPVETRRELAGVVAEWRRLQWPFRWVAPDALHVTLRFLGEVDREDEARIRDVLDECGRGTGWLDLVPTAYEIRPTRRRPRLIWLALEAVPALELLAHRLELALGASESGEGATFRPHVTLGRIVHQARLPGNASDVVAGATLPGPAGTDELVLYQSELDGGPPRYTARHVVSLMTRG